MALPTIDELTKFEELSIELEPQKRPQFTIIYGGADTGKTTAACYSPDPIIIPVGGEICHQRFPVPKMENKGNLTSIQHIFMCINWLLKQPHKRKTVIIDNLTCFRDIVENDVINTYAAAKGVKAQSLRDYDFGAGQAHCFQYYKHLLNGIEALMRKRDMHVILIAHDGWYNKTNPDGSYYSKCSINAPGGENTNARVLFESRCNNALFIRCEDSTREVTGAMGVKKRMATNRDTDRIIYTKSTSEFFAKTKMAVERSIKVEQSESEGELINEMTNETLKQLWDDLYA